MNREEFDSLLDKMIALHDKIESTEDQQMRYLYVLRIRAYSNLIWEQLCDGYRVAAVTLIVSIVIVSLTTLLW